MSLPQISAAEAKRLIDQGAVLIDIREPDEFARERIPGAQLVPLSRFDATALPAAPGQAVLFHCKSGGRTLGHAARLKAKAGAARKAAVLAGGIEAWKQAGLPVLAAPVASGRSLFAAVLGLFRGRMPQQ